MSKEEKLWFNMTDEEWQAERKKIQKIQAKHFSGFGEDTQKTFD